MSCINSRWSLLFSPHIKTCKIYHFNKEIRLLKKHLIKAREKSTRVLEELAICSVNTTERNIPFKQHNMLKTECLNSDDGGKASSNNGLGKLVNLLYHKTVLNLREVNLLQDEDDNSKYTCVNVKKNYVKSEGKDVSKLTTKELFYHKLFLKYQYPTNEEAEKLSAQFPDPLKLFVDVVRPLTEGDPMFQPQLHLISCLKNTYWKAQLTLHLSNKITVSGMHQDRNEAVRRAFLLVCYQFQVMGLIYQSDTGEWLPITCDRVVVMLETLSKHGTACPGDSKGRGFKVIFEQVKPKGDISQGTKVKDSEEKAEKSTDPIHDFYSRSFYVSEEKMPSLHPEYSKPPTLKASLDNAWTLKLNSDFCSLVTNIYELRSKELLRDNFFEVLLPTLVYEVDNDVGIPISSSHSAFQGRPFWQCTVHVGWPFPFTVTAAAISLPTSQIFGYLLTCMKFKKLKLLTADNREISPTGLKCLALKITHRHWYEHTAAASMEQSPSKKFIADAELYSDASSKGFGAYLLRDNCKQVNWLCEEWEDHNPDLIGHISEGPKHFLTTLAELYCLVTAVFSWKHKLKGKKLVCYCDNKSVVVLINSFQSNIIESSEHTCSFDYLIHVLQTTCLNHNIKVQFCWLNRDNNWLADCLARLDFHTFQAFVPQASANKSKSKSIRIQEKILLKRNQ